MKTVRDQFKEICCGIACTFIIQLNNVKTETYRVLSLSRLIGQIGTDPGRVRDGGPDSGASFRPQIWFVTLTGVVKVVSKS